MRLAAIEKGLNGRRKEARTTTQGQKGKRVGFKELLRINPDGGP
jgi:hypothetical protein